MLNLSSQKRGVVWIISFLMCLALFVAVPGCRQGNQGGGCFKDADCDDRNSCTTDLCGGLSADDQELEGTCRNTPECTTEAGCNDDDPCTTNNCFFGCCSFAPIECENGEECVDGVCGKPCTSGSDCDDMDLCTQDTCPNGSCQNPAVECDDGDLCTNDVCNGSTGDCDFLAKTCPSPEICDPATGDCLPIQCLIDADCDDGVFCNGKETCPDNGLPGLDADCQPGTNPCPDSPCNEATMSCDDTTGGTATLLLDTLGTYTGTAVCGDTDDRVSFDVDAGSYFGLGFDGENRTFFHDEPIGVTTTATDQDVFGTSGNTVTITALDSNTIRLGIVGPAACAVDLTKLPN